MNKSPAFQFYPDKWQSHTRRLSNESYRVYHELLCWMWQSSPDHCSVEASPEAVTCAVAMPIECVRNALAEINNAFAPLLKLEDGRWVSNGLRKEAIKQEENRNKAKNSANARWNHANASKNDANASFEQCIPIPIPIPISSSLNKDIKKEEKSGYHPHSRTVLFYLKEATGTNFREVDSNLKFISQRLKEPDVTLEGIKLMIDRQCRKWKGTEWEQYLQPSTLFNETKFESYYAKKDLPIQTEIKKPKSAPVGGNF